TPQSASRHVGDLEQCVKGNITEGEQHRDSITPKELRVVCDNMLQGLGRYLRCVGVNVLMLDNTDDHKVAAETPQSASRHVGDLEQCVKGNITEGEQHRDSITPKELRVVCDNMLQGLGRYLRCVGVNVLMLDNTDDHKVAAE
ncbi:exonuclease mut-7 homolog, partial [Tachysurus ichikawai]